MSNRTLSASRRQLFEGRISEDSGFRSIPLLLQEVASYIDKSNTGFPVLDGMLDSIAPVHGFVRKQTGEDAPLRLDYSVECEHCGYLKHLAPKLSEEQARRLLHDQGWRLIDDENRCPTCAIPEEHTPDEGEPHPATECETRGCVKLRKKAI